MDYKYIIIGVVLLIILFAILKNILTVQPTYAIIKIQYYSPKNEQQTRQQCEK